MSQIPQLILDRLGGSSFILRTRARRFHGLRTGLDFAFTGARRGINGVRITLDEAGKHTVVFGHWDRKGEEFSQASQHLRVEGASLRDLFAEQTGIGLD